MMMKPVFVFVWVFLLFTGCTSERGENRDADLLISNVNIVDIEAGEILQERDVLIKDGKIQDILPAAEPRRGPETLDGSGKYLVPGFWDNHVHFRGGEELIEENKNLLPLFIANGVTTVRDAGGDLTPSILEWKQQIFSGDLAGPEILTSGPKLDGPGSTWAGSIELSSPVEVPAAIDSLESLGVDYVKIYDSTLSGEVFLAIIDETEKRGLPVTGHMPYTVMFKESVERGLDATEHMYYVLKGSSSEEKKITDEIIRRQDTDNPLGFWGALEPLLETYDEDRARHLYRTMAEHNSAVVPTLHIGKVLSNLKFSDHSGDEYLNFMGPGIIGTYEGRLQGALNASDEATQRRIELHQTFVSMIADMHQEGVPVLAGSDSGPYNSYIYPGISLHEELQALVDAGLSPAEALKTSAPNGAEFFDMDDLYGKAETGFIADLVLLEENPLEDIENTRKIYLVILQGRHIYQQEELDRLLAEPDVF